jgi:hypothetical protein
MSKEKPGDDRRQKTDKESLSQTDEPWEGNPEKEQRRTGPPPDLEEEQNPLASFALVDLPLPCLRGPNRI